MKRHRERLFKRHKPQAIPKFKEETPQRDLQCSRCKAIFPDFLARCPECGSEEWVGLVEVNPYTQMPMENFIKACGHLLWISATLAFLGMLWHTNSPDTEINILFIYGAVVLLFAGVLCSAAYFGLSELMRRALRIQRRLRAFHENYRDEKPNPAQKIRQRREATRRTVIRGYGSSLK